MTDIWRDATDYAHYQGQGPDDSPDAPEDDGYPRPTAQGDGDAGWEDDTPEGESPF